MNSFSAARPPPKNVDNDGLGTAAQTRHTTGVMLSDFLLRSSRGDPAAFASLYDATSARSFGLVLRIVRNYALAEEVTQEAYFQAWQTAGRYEVSRGSALSWLLTIAHRRAVDRIRSTEAYNRNDTSYSQITIELERDITADAANASLEAVRVRKAVALLSPVQRQAIELAYFRGHTYAEVAQILEIPLGTAKTRIRDGLIRLRDII